jgi:hypothetical protein
VVVVWIVFEGGVVKVSSLGENLAPAASQGIWYQHRVLLKGVLEAVLSLLHPRNSEGIPESHVGSVGGGAFVSLAS